MSGLSGGFTVGGFGTETQMRNPARNKRTVTSNTTSNSVPISGSFRLVDCETKSSTAVRDPFGSNKNGFSGTGKALVNSNTPTLAPAPKVGFTGSFGKPKEPKAVDVTQNQTQGGKSSFGNSSAFNSPNKDAVKEEAKKEDVSPFKGFGTSAFGTSAFGTEPKVEVEPVAVETQGVLNVSGAFPQRVAPAMGTSSGRRRGGGIKPETLAKINAFGTETRAADINIVKDEKGEFELPAPVLKPAGENWYIGKNVSFEPFTNLPAHMRKPRFRPG